MLSGPIPEPTPVLSDNHWQLVRTIDVPDSDATYADDDWLDDQDVVAAKTAGSAIVQSTSGSDGGLAGIAIMITLFEADGSMYTGAELAASLVGTIHLEEIAHANTGDHTSVRRLLSVESLTDMASAGMQAIARTTKPVPRGEYAIRLAGVADMPAEAGKKIAVHARLV